MVEYFERIKGAILEMMEDKSLGWDERGAVLTVAGIILSSELQRCQDHISSAENTDTDTDN